MTWKVWRDGEVIQQGTVASVLCEESAVLGDWLTQDGRSGGMAPSPISGSGFTEALSTDTASSHPGWTVLGSPDVGLDPSGSALDVVGQVATVTRLYRVLQGCSLRGMAVFHGGGTRLWSVATMDETVDLEGGDTIELTYSLTVSGIQLGS